MIKLDDLTEIEIKDGILTISQFDNNEVILIQDNLKKLLEAINYTRCCEELCDVCNNNQVFETEDGYTADCPRCN